MTKYSLLLVLGAITLAPAANAQFGFASNFGAATSRKITEQMNSSLRNGTRAFGTGSAAKGGKAGTASAAAAKPAANVPPPPPLPPPPPPLQRNITNTRKFTAPAWMTNPAAAEPAAPQAPVNVDLAQIERGMARESLLALGKPTSKMTLSEDGHLIEVYHYRNQTLASGTVRLRDGAVVTIEARP